MAALLAVAPALLVTGAGSVAVAQTSCGAVPIGAQVTIDKPSAGVVTLPFVVSGRAVSTLGLSRVDLLIGGTVVASRTYPASTNLNFEFSVGSNEAPPGARSVSVVACSAGLSLVRGQSPAVVVDVQKLPVAATTTTTTAPTAPVASITPAPSTTVVAVPVTDRSTTTTSKPVGARKVLTPPPRDREAAADPEGLADTSADAAADRPIRLTDGDRDKGSGRPPLWVGAVVGLSGLGGLVLSGLVRRRSAPTDATDPTDPTEPARSHRPPTNGSVDPPSLSRSGPPVRTG